MIRICLSILLVILVAGCGSELKQSTVEVTSISHNLAIKLDDFIIQFNKKIVEGEIDDDFQIVSFEQVKENNFFHQFNDNTSIGGTVDSNGNITSFFIAGTDISNISNMTKQVIKIFDKDVNAAKVIKELNSKGSTTKNFIKYNSNIEENFALYSIDSL